MMQFHYCYSFFISLSSKLLNKILKIEVQEWTDKRIVLVDPKIAHWHYQLLWIENGEEKRVVSKSPIVNFDIYDYKNNLTLMVVDADSDSLICEIGFRRCL